MKRIKSLVSLEKSLALKNPFMLNLIRTYNRKFIWAVVTQRESNKTASWTNYVMRVMQLEV